MNIEKVDIKTIKLNDNNPRVVNDSKFRRLVQSLKDFPDMLKIRPIVVDENNIVLGGNMRLIAANKIGLKEVWIIKADNLTDEQKNEFIIKDNIGYGDWDWDVLKSDWDKSHLLDWGLDLPTNLFDSIDTDDKDDKEDNRNIMIDNLFQLTISFNSEQELKEHYDKLIALSYQPKITII